VTEHQEPVIDALRTAAELQAKLTGLATELEAWRAASSGPDRPLRRHHTQVEAVAGTLEQAAGDLARQLDGADEGLWILERSGSIDRRIMDLHRLWGFFRDKLALRFVPWLEPPLVTADDLAWACYSPAQRFIPEHEHREPPLVYFTGGTSPFLLPRGAPYVVEPLPDGSLREPEFAEAVRLIPVALIGLPWLQVDHLPDAPLISHEVGHAVEQDLGLAATVRKLIDGAVPAGHRAAWGAWSAEVFADVYGTLGCGSGFARALMALLAGHPRVVAGEVRTDAAWGSYPTRTLRVLLASAVLAKLRVQPSDRPVADTWLEAYPRRSLAEYEPDVEKVASAVLEGPYDALGRQGLTAVLGYAQADEEIVSRLAERLLDGLSVDAGEIRHVIAAARLAYDRDRRGFARSRAAAIARAWIKNKPFDRVRAAGGQDTPPEEARSLRDQAAGRALSRLINRVPDDQEAADVPARHE
jgi:hypothetical protein